MQYTTHHLPEIKGCLDFLIFSTPSEGVELLRCLYRLCGSVFPLTSYLTPSEGVVISAKSLTPLEGVELRNRLGGVSFPSKALKFGKESARTVRLALSQLNGMDELGRLCGMFRLLPVIFTAADCSFAGRPVRMEREVRRMQQVSAYVMAHYVHPIALDDIAAEVGMNRSAFSSWFRRCKGMTFSQFVMQYRLDTACSMLEHSRKSVSEICWLVGFNDVPHFVRVFTREKGVPPGKYRKRQGS